jgi:hypothetical protein
MISMAEKTYETYELYLSGHKQDIENGTPFAMEVRDAEDYRRMVVKAKVSPTKDKLENPARLCVREEQWEHFLTDEMWIQIIEELDDDVVVERPESTGVRIRYGSA